MWFLLIMPNCSTLFLLSKVTICKQSTEICIQKKPKKLDNTQLFRLYSAIILIVQVRNFAKLIHNEEVSFTETFC